jgi:hypothetical protein
MQHDIARRTFNLARRADYALIGIGGLGPESHVARPGWSGQEEMRRSQEDGLVDDLTCRVPHAIPARRPRDRAQPQGSRPHGQYSCHRLPAEQFTGMGSSARRSGPEAQNLGDG